MMGQAMEYPAEFVQRVQSALPQDAEIVLLMATGSAFSVVNKLEVAGKSDLVEEWRQIFENRPSPNYWDGFSS